MDPAGLPVFVGAAVLGDTHAIEPDHVSGISTVATGTSDDWVATWPAVRSARATRFSSSDGSPSGISWTDWGWSLHGWTPGTVLVAALLVTLLTNLTGEPLQRIPGP